MKKMPIICPSCEAFLTVSSLSCSNCDTVIHGNYQLPIFLRLPQEEQEFILNFVLAGGSLKALAKQIGKSYPTVRNRLDDIIENLKQLSTHEKD